MDRYSYAVVDARYPVPAWAQRFVARVDRAPARWKRPAAQGLTAAEALRLLEGLCDSKGAWLSDWVGRQEVQDGCAGHAARDDGPVDGGTTSWPQTVATPPWLSWPLLSLPS